MPSKPNNIYQNLFYRNEFDGRTFQDLCQQLLSAEHENFRIIEDSSGDFGCDGYDRKSENLYAIYYPSRPGSEILAKNIKKKLLSDIQKAFKFPFPVSTFTFITPFDPDKGLWKIWAEHKRSLPFTVDFIGQTKIQEWLRKYPDISDKFFDFNSNTKLSLLISSQKKLLSVLSSPETLAEKLKTDILIRVRRRQRRLTQEGGDWEGAETLAKQADQALTSISNIVQTIFSDDNDDASSVTNEASSIFINSGAEAALDYLEAAIDETWTQIEQLNRREKSGQEELAIALKPIMLQIDILQSQLKWSDALFLLDKTSKLCPTSSFVRRKLGEQLFELGRFSESLEHLQAASFVSRTDIERCLSLNRLATCYQQLARNEESEAAFREALRLAQKCSESDRVREADIMNNLGLLLRDQDRLREAEDLIIESIKILEASPISDILVLSEALNNLGVLNRSKGNFKFAKSLLRRSLQILKIERSPWHPAIAVRLNNLGTVTMRMGQYKMSERLFSTALRIGIRNFGPHHPLIGLRKGNLALALYRQDKLEESERHANDALEIIRNTEGEISSTYSKTLTKLAYIGWRRGQLSVAEKGLKRALRIEEKVRAATPFHPQLAEANGHVAIFYLETGSYNKAQYYSTKAVHMEFVSILENGSGTEYFDSHINTFKLTGSRLSMTTAAIEKALQKIRLRAKNTIRKYPSGYIQGARFDV